MDLLDKIDFAQLPNRVEKEYLAACASEVPRSGTIVDIGTAQGGSAAIFYNFSKKNSVQIYSYDIKPCLEARERLRGTNVNIVQKASVEAAKEWSKGNRSIDLLFIDGGHAFHNVFQDFNSWIKYVKPEGKVLLHDYGPIEEGGVYHLAVRILGDAILKLGILEKPKQVFSILSGELGSPCPHVSVEGCTLALRTIGLEIIRIREQYKNIRIEGKYRDLLKLLLHTNSPLPKTDVGEKNSSFSINTNSAVEPSSSVIVSDLIFCYLIDYCLNENEYYDRLVSLSPTRFDLFHWHEAISMLDYSRGNRRFPENLDDLPKLKDEFELSRFVAFEQAKLFMLSKIALPLISRNSMNSESSKPAKLVDLTFERFLALIKGLKGLKKRVFTRRI